MFDGRLGRTSTHSPVDTQCPFLYCLSLMASEPADLSGTPTESPAARRTWLATSAAAAYLGISSRTLTRWADNGRVPSQRNPAGHRRFNLADLNTVVQDALLAQEDLASAGEQRLSLKEGKEE